MSRVNFSTFANPQILVLIAILLIGALVPAAAFAQESGPERPINSNKLPFLREASSGGAISGGSGISAYGNASGSNRLTPSEPVNVVKVEQGGLESQTNNCRFRDISGHRSETAINYLYDKGVAGGRKPCYFVPDAPVTRAEVTTMVVRATDIAVPANAEPAAFPDTNTKDWSAKHVKAAKQSDIVHGYPDGLFRADKPVNVVETLKITTRGFDVDEAELDFAKLSRVYDISLDQWYIPYVQAGFDQGLIVDNAVSIAPASEVTRAEAAEVIYILMRRQEF